jgi:hypothetical protein
MISQVGAVKVLERVKKSEVIRGSAFVAVSI